MEAQNTSQYWLDAILDTVEQRAAGQPVLVCSGITPSGPYHVGHAREILTAEAVRRGLELRGLEARHMHNVDDFDALRKRYAYLPESYEQEAGKPVYIVPAPDGRSASYAEQYFSAYAAAAEKLGIPMEIWRSHEEYQAGKFAEVITTALQRRDDIARILETISHREVPTDWQPVQILDAATQNLRTAEFLSFDTEAGLVEYRSADGAVKQADIRAGEVKLDWRVDWPARWHMLGVTVEGFGKEHATKGGSYDTGSAIQREVFGTEPPIPVPFNPINLKGDTRKMSSSIGNLVTIDQALEFIPPDVLRYFVFKSMPSKVLEFDPGLGMYNLIDEFAATEAAVQAGLEAQFEQAWRVSVLDPSDATISTIPYSHLVTTYQAARQQEEATLALLKKTHPSQVEAEGAVIQRELTYIKNWLQTEYAPESIKFALADELPDVTPTAEGADFLQTLASDYPETPEAEVVQTLIFETAKAHDVQPRDGFKLLYRLFIQKDAGPKLGGFLADLDRDFVMARLRRER
ncbi:lysine--tRNA ligase [bacterium]|nr:lysine--tRNA ligase [bacterium]